MGEISGVPTADINNIDGFFTTQGGGGGITPNSIDAAGSTGTQIIGSGVISSNPDVTLNFNIGASITTRFTKIEGGGLYNNFVAITANGELWYNYEPGAAYANWTTADSTWRRYGTDTNWDDISMYTPDNVVMAVRDGDLWFVGYGSFRHRGDGNTASESSWIEIQDSLTWSKIRVGYRKSIAITTTGEVYFSGYNYDYMTAQGTQSGSTATRTRDQNNLTGVTEAEAGSYRTALLVKDGNIYQTGRNNYRMGGPLIASTSDVNGPTLSYNGGDVVTVCGLTYWSAFAITNTGQLRFAGTGSYRQRPDNSTASQSFTTNAMDVIDGGATGYTLYSQRPSTTASTYPAICIKNGQMKVGGGSDSYVLKEVLGNSPNTTAWVNLGNTTAVAGIASQTTAVISK